MNWKATDILRMKILRSVFTETFSCKAVFLWGLFPSLWNRQNFKGEAGMSVVWIYLQAWKCSTSGDGVHALWTPAQGPPRQTMTPSPRPSPSLYTLQSIGHPAGISRGAFSWNRPPWKTRGWGVCVWWQSGCSSLSTVTRSSSSSPAPGPGRQIDHCKANTSGQVSLWFLPRAEQHRLVFMRIEGYFS